MKKFLRRLGYAALALFVLVFILFIFMWDTRPFTRERAPLNIAVTEDESPFEVQERQEEVRDMIDERLQEAPRPDFRARFNSQDAEHDEDAPPSAEPP